MDTYSDKEFDSLYPDSFWCYNYPERIKIEDVQFKATLWKEQAQIYTTSLKPQYLRIYEFRILTND